MGSVLRYATSVIESTKLYLVISPFSHEKTKDGVRSLTFLEAMGIANVMTVVPGTPETEEISGGQRVLITGDNIYRAKGASGIKWDDNAASVTFSYRVGEEETRTVWVENQFSAGFKLEAVQAFRLAGLAIEDVSENAGAAAILPAVDALVRGGQTQLLRPEPRQPAAGVDGQRRQYRGRRHRRRRHLGRSQRGRHVTRSPSWSAMASPAWGAA